MIRKLAGLVVLGAVLAVMIWLVPSSARAQSLVDIFDLGMGARPLSLGGAFAALADDENAVLYNPAGLATLAEFHFGSLFESRFARINDGSIAIAAPHFGGGLFFLDVGNIPHTDETGQTQGAFDYGNFGLIAGAGYLLSDILGASAPDLPLALGGQLKFLSVSSPPAGNGVSFALSPSLLLDLGGYQLGLADLQKIRVGLTLQNLIGLPLCYNNGHCEPWAIGAKLGFSADVAHQLRLAFDLDTSGDLHLGGEWHLERADLLREGFEELALRLGIMTTGNVFSFTAGFGVAYQYFSLDYAFISHPDLGGSHRISLGAHIDTATLFCLLSGQRCPTLKD